MAAEYTDVGNKGQLSLCIRWISPQTFQVFEDFIGFYEVRDIKSNTNVSAIKDILLRLGLSFDKLRGQTYDGASNMLGPKSGVGLTKGRAVQFSTGQNKAAIQGGKECF